MPTRKEAMPEDLEEASVPEDLDELEEGDLDSLDVDAEEDLADEDLVVDVDDDDDDDLATADLDVDEDDESDGELLTPEPAAVVERTGEETEDEEEEEPEDEDVEASLDVILKERLVVEDEPEDDELADVDDRSEPTERVLPKQPGEFVCRSCFLVKHPSQLADAKNMYCRDCV
jgi:Domain of unknown function (DUF4193)